MKYLKKLKTNIDRLDVYYKGCTLSEIQNVEQNIANGNLPDCYKEFLQYFGKDMDRKEGKSRGYLVGNAVFYDDLEDNNNDNGLKGLLEEDESSLQVPDNAFIFYGSQGILYAFFKLDEGNNPPVYGYAEGFNGNNFPKITDSLSDFYEKYLEGENIFNVLY